MKTLNDRDETIRKIKTALHRRSGKVWSVTGGRGTAWGWIQIDAAPSRCTWSHRLKPDCDDRPENYEEFNSGKPGRSMSPDDRDELGKLLGLDGKAHHQGVSIAPGSDDRREYIERAEGQPVTKIAQPYWD
jgi:hypothetical protein